MSALRAIGRIAVRHAVSMAIAIGSTAAASALVLVAFAAFGRSFPATFMLAVIISAWLGGVSSGTLASVLGAVALDYFVQEPRFAFSVASVPDALQLLFFIIAGLVVSYLVRTRQETREELDEQAQALQIMRERERIAMDLHDGMIQSLYAATLKLATVRRQLPRDAHAARSALELAGQSILEEIEGVRAYIAALRSGSVRFFDLKTALEALCDELDVQTRARVSFDIQDQAASAVNPLQIEDVLHIAREGLSNAVRHARASGIHVSLLHSDGALKLMIEDNGHGFDPEDERTRGDGLRNMRERSLRIRGRLTVVSQPGKGSTISLSLPAAKERLPAEVA